MRSTPGGRRRSTPVPFVVVTPRWSGERVLVRLLAAGGSVRCSGRVLARPVPDPAGHLRRVLARGSRGDLAHGAIVHPTDLWLTNGVDPFSFVSDLVDEGVHLLVLVRRDHVDSGLSRALCGPDGEILPRHPRSVGVGDVAVFTRYSRLVEEWADTALPAAPRLVFEDDLAGADARAATVTRLAPLLRVPPWPPPPEPEVPDTAALWRRVVDGAGLARRLGALGLPTPTAGGDG